VRLYRAAFITSGSRVHESCGGVRGWWMRKNTRVWVDVGMGTATGENLGEDNREV